MIKKLNGKQNNILKIGLIIVISTFNYFLHLKCSKSGVIHFDCATHILRAQDILNGNIFLKDWYGTTVNGVFTWLLYAIFSIFITGFNLNAIYVSWALAFSVMVFLILLLTFKFNNNYLNIVIVITSFIFFFCNVNLFEFSWGSHIELITYIIGILIILQSIYLKNENKNKLFIIFYILLFLANLSDTICLYLLTIPLIIISLIRYIRNINKIDKKIFISSSIIIICSQIIDKILVSCGIWQHIGVTGKFCSYQDCFSNIADTIKLYIDVFQANFFGEEVFSFQSIFKILNFLLMVVCIFVFYYDIKKIQKMDIVTQILLVAIIIQTSAFIFSELYCGRPMRYIIPCVIYMLILVSRFDWYNFFNQYIINKFKNTNAINAIKPLFIVFFIFTMIAKIPFINIKSLQIQNQPYCHNYYNILKFLTSKHLNNGYANMDVANIITLLSKGNITTRDIVINNVNNIYMQQNYWSTKSSWYVEPANFIITDNTIDANNNFFKTDELEYILGKPKEVHNLEDWTIYIYDYDISKKVNSDYNLFYTGSRLNYNNDLSYCNDDKLILKPKDIQFGPYSSLKKGQYVVTISGKNLDKGCFDICYNKGINVIKIKNANKSSDEITYMINVRKELKDLEFRCKNNSNKDDIIIDSLNIRVVY